MILKLFKIIIWLLLCAVILIFVGYVFCEVNKKYWDDKVKEMCVNDGGVRIYKEVIVSEAEYNKHFDKDGGVYIPSELSAKSDEYFYARSSSKRIILNTYPEVYSRESTFYRLSDDEIIAKSVWYSRTGGDFPIIIMHRSSFGCADVDGFNLDVESEILKYKGDFK